MYLLIVTGMSGAGKSTALKALEELGYYCVDNLPSPMLPAFVEMCNQAKPPIERAAVAVDSRESLPWVRRCCSPCSLHLRTDLLYTSYHIIAFSHLEAPVP